MNLAWKYGYGTPTTVSTATEGGIHGTREGENVFEVPCTSCTSKIVAFLLQFKILHVTFMFYDLLVCSYCCAYKTNFWVRLW